MNNTSIYIGIRLSTLNEVYKLEIYFSLRDNNIPFIISKDNLFLLCFYEDFTSITEILKDKSFYSYLYICEIRLNDENGKYTIYDSYGHDDNAPQMFFTREDIGSMSSAEFAKNESAIMAQLKERGIPSRKDLPSGKKSYNHREKSNGSSKGSNSSDGKWVTINGNHVLIKN